MRKKLNADLRKSLFFELRIEALPRRSSLNEGLTEEDRKRRVVPKEPATRRTSGKPARRVGSREYFLTLSRELPPHFRPNRCKPMADSRQSA